MNLGLYVKNSICTPNVYFLSDRREKQNIKALDLDATEIIKKVKPVQYEMKSNPSLPQWGVIAQELQEVLPDAVIPMERLHVDYQMLYITHLKATQELTKRIDALEKKLANYE